MKYLSSFIVSAFICMSTSSQTVKSPIKTSSTDACLVDFTKHTFPKKWEHDANDSIYWLTSISNDRYFESLSSMPQQKLDMLPQKDSMASDCLLDSAYYCKTLYSTKQYTLSIYKSGSKYQSKKGDEMFAPVDYLVLVTRNAKQRIIDYLVCYYYVHRLYESAERYFYIDNNKNITLVNFYTDELETTFQGRCTYHIGEQGRFIISPSAGEILSNRLKRYIYCN